MSNKVVRYGGQALLYAAFAAFVGYFSASPVYQHLSSGDALLRLSFRHPGAIAADCRKRSEEELAKLPPHLRADQDCPRERSPVRVRVELNGDLLYDESFQPSGLRRDGAASAYRRLPIPAGEHHLRVRFNDDVRVDGFNHQGERRMTLAPGQVVLIDFIADQGGVLIK